MRYLVNSEEMKRCDGNTINEFGMPSLVLMERAALAVYEELVSCGFDLSRVLVVCGSGNNGGDGFAIARLLHLSGKRVDVLFAGKPESLTEETQIQKKICENYGVNVGSNLNISEYTSIVDALFGVGLSRNIEGRYAALIGDINRSGIPVLSVDIPSGISADSGHVMGTAVKAAKTVTFAFEKIGHILYPGSEYCGELKLCAIGIDDRGFMGQVPGAFTWEESDIPKLLPERKAYSNKGTYGRGLLAAGSRDMAGAACLAGKAAYKTGTGLVRIYSEDCNRQILQTLLPEAVLTSYRKGEEGAALADALQWADACAVGPGLSVSSEKLEILQTIIRSGDIPAVLDADALNLLSVHMELLEGHRQPLILTPHIGEMARLTGIKKEELILDLPGYCLDFARKNNVVCVLKDARTVVSDGKSIYINTSGNDGMAAGGSGDVLCGLILGLLAQGIPPFRAATAGVYLHGLAGDDARRRCGARGMLAGDIAESVGAVMSWDTEDGRASQAK